MQLVSIAMATSPARPAWISNIEILFTCSDTQVSILQVNFSRFIHGQRCPNRQWSQWSQRWLKCCNKEKGCQWHGELKYINNHLDKCPYHTVLCTSSKELRLVQDATMAGISRNPISPNSAQRDPTHARTEQSDWRVSDCHWEWPLTQLPRHENNLHNLQARRSNEFWLICTRRYVNWSQFPASTGR